MFGRGPPTLVCYICGREFGTTSLKIHQPKCADLFLKREALKPKRERRKLPEPPSAATAGGKEPVGMSREQFNEQAMDKFKKEGLLPCPHCGRTFFEDPLKIHLRSCRSDSISRPVGAKAAGGGGGGQHRGKAAAGSLPQPSPTAPPRSRAPPRTRAPSRPQVSSQSANEVGTSIGSGRRVKKVKQGTANAKQSPHGTTHHEEIAALERRLGDLKARQSSPASPRRSPRAAELAAAQRRRGVNLDILRRLGSPRATADSPRASADPAGGSKHTASRVALIQMVDEAEEQQLLTEEEAEQLHVMISNESEMLRDVYLAAKASSKNPVQRFAKNARRTLRLEREM